jgi:large subunit ribosomal protein L20
MPRAVSGIVRKKRTKKVLKRAKGFQGRRSKIFSIANQAVYRAWANEYIGRKLKKRDFRKLWNVRINAAVRAESLSYSTFMYGLKKAGVQLNRKMLAELAINNPAAMKEVINVAKSALKK